MRLGDAARLGLMLLLIGLVGQAEAHEVRPALLRITEGSDGRYDVLWKQPVMGTLAVHLAPTFSGIDLEALPATVDTTPEFQVREWRGLDLGHEGIQGRTLKIDGLSQTITDTLVSIVFADGESQQTVLHPQDSELTLSGHKAGIAVTAYWLLGVEHILTGADHLCFVLALLLLVRSRLMLFKTITAFTVAHSMTLAAVALHWVVIRPALIEALVALSIVVVAAELARACQGESTVTARYPWIIAFTFGLLHGAAFAGALADVGMPSASIPAALFLFNLGVECGQVLFVAAVMGLLYLASRLREEWPGWVRWVPPYAIGCAAAVWFIQRLQVAMA